MDFFLWFLINRLLRRCVCVCACVIRVSYVCTLAFCFSIQRDLFCRRRFLVFWIKLPFPANSELIDGLGPGGLDSWDPLMKGIATSLNPKPPGPTPPIYHYCSWLGWHWDEIIPYNKKWTLTNWWFIDVTLPETNKSPPFVEVFFSQKRNHSVRVAKPPPRPVWLSWRPIDMTLGSWICWWICWFNICCLKAFRGFRDLGLFDGSKTCFWVIVS